MELYDIHLNFSEDFLISQFNEFGYSAMLHIINPIGLEIFSVPETVGSILINPSFQNEPIFKITSTFNEVTCHAKKSSNELLHHTQSRRRAAPSPVSVPSNQKRSLLSTKPFTPASRYLVSGDSRSVLEEMFSESIFRGEKLFMCMVCSYKSKQKGSMLRHVQCVHSDNPPSFRCTMCGTCFKERGNLKSHYKGKHKMEDSIAKAAANLATG